MADSSPGLALVTGTTSGIGAAVADALLARNWDVVGVARRVSTIAHGRYRHFTVDLQDLQPSADALTREVAPILQDAGRRVGLVNNAATPDPLRPFDAIDPADFMRVYALNTAAPAWLMGLVLRHANAAAAIRIVNVSSVAAVQGFGGLAAYGASKAALRLIGMVAAAELDAPPPGVALRDVSILSYDPGVVETPMQAHARSQPVEDFPWVGLFHEFKARGMLIAPERPAREIVEFLESDHQPRFAEGLARP